MKKMKIKINDVGKIYLLEEYGEITYVDKMMNLVFIMIPNENVTLIQELPFVIRVSESRNGALLAV